MCDFSTRPHRELFTTTDQSSASHIQYGSFKEYKWKIWADECTGGRMWKERSYNALWERVWKRRCLSFSGFTRSLFWSVEQLWIIHPSPNTGGSFKPSFTSVNWVSPSDCLETTHTHLLYTQWGHLLIAFHWLVSWWMHKQGNELSDATGKLAVTSGAVVPKLFSIMYFEKRPSTPWSARTQFVMEKKPI